MRELHNIKRKLIENMIFHDVQTKIVQDKKNSLRFTRSNNNGIDIQHEIEDFFFFNKIDVDFYFSIYDKDKVDITFI